MLPLQPGFTIGRGDDLGVRLGDGCLSRRHAEISIDDPDDGGALAPEEPVAAGRSPPTRQELAQALLKEQGNVARTARAGATPSNQSLCTSESSNSSLKSRHLKSRLSRGFMYYLSANRTENRVASG